LGCGVCCLGCIDDHHRDTAPPGCQIGPIICKRPQLVHGVILARATGHWEQHAVQALSIGAQFAETRDIPKVKGEENRRRLTISDATSPYRRAKMTKAIPSIASVNSSGRRAFWVCVFHLCPGTGCHPPIPWMVAVSRSGDHSKWQKGLLQLVQEAEAAGFHCAMSSDHFKPWGPAQGHGGNSRNAAEGKGRFQCRAQTRRPRRVRSRRGRS
jgi:hypothetical protein